MLNLTLWRYRKTRNWSTNNKLNFNVKTDDNA